MKYIVKCENFEADSAVYKDRAVAVASARTLNKKHGEGTYKVHWIDDEQNTLNIDAAIVDFKTWDIDYPEDAYALREYGETFARAVAAFIMDLDALELPQVAEVMARHGVRI